MILTSEFFFRALPVHLDPEIRYYLTTLHYFYKGSPKKEGLNQNVPATKDGVHIWFWQVKNFPEPYGLVWI